ncbi:ABC transporter ATP-binding protein [candidate division KSB1 bacterium]|nr:ABC transporter ATP-binding protein [candidate division KSB1 bacterium]
MSKAIIQIRDLHTRYGEHEILKGITLDIFPNETFVILGRSGCGKSTLMRHMIGLQKPDQGSVFVKGIDLLSAGEKEREQMLKKIGVLFQGSALFNSMTIGDNVALPLREHTRLEKSTVDIMTRLKLDLVGLSGFETFMPAQLSGGMRKRAALARALTMDPDILFCDEPSAGLDPIVAVGIDHLILKLKKAFKMTIVIVTHELASVFLIADRIALLHDGHVVFLGDKAAFKKDGNPVVRQFIERLPDSEPLDGSKYLQTLIGDSFHGI